MKVHKYIGKTEDGPLELGPGAVTLGYAFLGRRGRGKSNLLGVFLEILASRGDAFVCLDPARAHWGIRFAAGPDGRPIGPSGFNVLLVGGPHADIPVEQTTGEEFAQIVVEGNISAVVDMKDMGFTERQTWCAAFAGELFRLNKTPRFIAFEEAHNFLPQKLQFEEQKKVSYAMGKLIEEGRSSGLGYGLASQRAQKINKDQLSQVDTMFALGLMAPQDIEAVADWFKHNVPDKQIMADILADLPKMPAGDAWVLSPEWLGKVVKLHARYRDTYHAGRTPKPGESTVNVDKFSVTEAVKKLRERFAAKQVQRRADAKDLKEANTLIRKLEAELKKKAVSFTPAAPVKIQETSKRDIDRAVHVATRDVKETLRLTQNLVGNIQRQVESSLTKIDAVVGQLKLIPHLKLPFSVTVDVDPKAKREPYPPPIKEKQVREVMRSALKTYQDNGTPKVSDPELKEAHIRILAALAKLEAVGQDKPRKEQAAAWAGRAPGGGAFQRPLGNLNAMGYVEYKSPGTVSLTAQGRAVIGPQTPPADQAELEEMVFAVLKPPQRVILKALMAHGTEAIPKAQLAEESGKAEGGGAFQRPVGKLNSGGFLEYPERGMVRAVEWLFLE